MTKLSKNDSKVSNRFLLLDQLGAGGMGEVFLARDLLHGAGPELVALKFLSGVAVKHSVDLFRAEFLLLAQLHHPHLAQVYDFGFDPTRQAYYFSSEFIEGEDLQKATNGKPLSAKLALLLDLVRVIEFIHRQGVVHCDIKPSNVLVAKDGVKLLDFGISTFLDAAGERSHSVVGTPGFIAPELFHEGSPSAASDIFSLGVLFLRVITEKIPKGGTKQPAHPGFLAADANVSQGLATLVNEMVQPLPLDRPTSMREIFERLGDLLPENKAEGSRHTSPTVNLPWVDVGGILEGLRQRVEKVAGAPLPNFDSFSVEGANGSGKTRLLKEIARFMQTTEVGVCKLFYFKPTPSPFAPWETIALQMLGLSSADIVEKKKWLEAIRFKKAHVESQGEFLFEREDSSRLVGFLVNEMREISRRKAVVFIFDDIHHWPLESLRILIRLIDLDLAACRFIVANAPGIDWGKGSNLRKIRLLPFSPHQVETMFMQLFGSQDAVLQLAQEVATRSEGNPRMVDNIVTRLISDRALMFRHNKWEVAAGAAKIIAEFQKPQKVDWQARNKDTQDLYAFASLLKAPFLADSLARMLGKPLVWVIQVLDRDVKRGIFSVDSESHFFWRTREVQQQALDVIFPPDVSLQNRRKNLHKKIADAFLSQAHGARQPLAIYEEAFSHYHLAGNIEECLSVGLTLAKAHLESWEVEKAHRALMFLEKHCAHLATKEQIFVLQNLTETAAVFESLDSALQFASRLLEVVKSDPEIDAYTRLMRSAILRKQGKPAAALDEIKAGLACLGKKTSSAQVLRARFLAQQSVLFLLEKRYVDALASIDSSLSLIDKISDPYVYCNSLNLKGTILLYEGDRLKESQEILSIALEGFRKINHVQGMVYVLTNLGVVSGLQKNFAQQREYLEKSYEMAQVLGDSRRTLPILLALAREAIRELELPKALEFFQKFKDLAQISGDVEFLPEAQFELANLYLLKAEYVNAENILRSLHPQQPQILLRRILCAFYLGRSAEMRRHIATYRKAFLSDGRERDFGLTVVLSHIATEEHAYEEALQLFKEVAPFFAKAKDPDVQFEGAVRLCFLNALAKNEGLDETSAMKDLKAIAKVADGARRINLYTIFFALAAREKVTPAIEALLLQQFADEKSHVRKCNPEASAAISFHKFEIHQRKSEVTKAVREIQTLQHLLEEMPKDLTEADRVNFFKVVKRQHMLAVIEREKTIGILLGLNFTATRRERQLLHLLLRILVDLDFSTVPKFIASWSNKVALTSTEFSLRFIPLIKGQLQVEPQQTREAAFTSLQEGHVIELNGATYFPFRPAFTEQKAGIMMRKPLGVVCIETGLNKQERQFVIAGIDACEALLKIGSQLARDKTRLHGTLKTLSSLSISFDSERDMIPGMAGGESASMQALFSLMKRLRFSEVNILILGESGTGKELIARQIHARGPLASHPFVVLNCAALPQHLVESHLFGHLKGSFTDAMVDYPGLIAQAQGGTLFLDEIGELPLETQVKLLRFLQNGEIQPLGANHVLNVRCRVIAASHRDLAAMVAEKKFREDLFYRLRVAEIVVPPLRERKEDISGLIDFYVHKVFEANGRGRVTFSNGAMKILKHFYWPGNVRQLFNVLERTLSTMEGRKVEVKDLPDDIVLRPSHVKKTMAQAESAFLSSYFSALLKRTNGNIQACLKISGMSRATFYRASKQIKS